MARCDTLLRSGTLVHAHAMERGDIAIDQGMIVAVGNCQSWEAETSIDCQNLNIFPGAIDAHVHFRQPGGSEKEDWPHGSRSALLGGITTICDMPNTDPPTVSTDLFDQKRSEARGQMYVDYGFWFGVNRDSLNEAMAIKPRQALAGIKVYMAETTGSLLYEDDMIESLLGQKHCRVAFHAEDQSRLNARLLACQTANVRSHSVWRDPECGAIAIRRIASWCKRQNVQAYILHVSSESEINEINRERAHLYCEATPHHLVLTSPASYERLGTKVQVNPPIRSEHDRRALIQALRRGLIDTIGSDHAPHTLAEKAQDYPNSPSGFPGCQTLLPLMLDLFWREEIPLPMLASAISTKPASILGLHDRGRIKAGCLANLTVVDINCIKEVKDEDMVTLNGWTPYAGMRLRGWPVATFLHGRQVMRDGEVIGEPFGQPIPATQI